MPTYSYACKDCDNAFDIQQAFSDDALTACPQCGGTLRKRYGSVGVVFKGSGFYRTDSRNGAVKPSTTPATAGAAASSESSGAGSSATEGSSASTGTSSSAAASTGSSAPAAST